MLRFPRRWRSGVRGLQHSPRNQLLTGKVRRRSEFEEFFRTQELRSVQMSLSKRFARKTGRTFLGNSESSDGFPDDFGKIFPFCARVKKTLENCSETTPKNRFFSPPKSMSEPPKNRFFQKNRKKPKKSIFSKKSKFVRDWLDKCPHGPLKM